ncbi:MAG TPA: 2-C-methyl-D-erythritol 2,4-cyclodiphosphate synthase [Ktedonobacteraceae bacterium]|nr:2-C-methyl-D-erythritol 2,4-cyclodiphosphate synthase [Ktedonobacteraceae bacterium]
MEREQNQIIQIIQIIHQILSDRLRIGTGIDFHSLHKGYPLVLAGITIPYEKGFHVKRSDGDPVSHALVDALLAATGKGDIADWFNDQDEITNARSIDYLDELRTRILQPEDITIINVQVIILAEQPKLKPFFPKMQQEIATHLKIDPHRVSIQGKTFEGKGIIGQQQGIEVQATITLLL